MTCFPTREAEFIFLLLKLETIGFQPKRYRCFVQKDIWLLTTELRNDHTLRPKGHCLLSERSTSDALVFGTLDTGQSVTAPWVKKKSKDRRWTNVVKRDTVSSDGKTLKWGMERKHPFGQTTRHCTWRNNAIVMDKLRYKQKTKRRNQKKKNGD